MNKNWIAVNVILCLVAALLAWQLGLSVKRFYAENDLARIQPAQDFRQKIALEGNLAPFQPPKRYEPADFGVIPAKNLFAETRAREEKIEVQQVADAPPLVIKPILVGVTIAEDQRLASIIEPSMPNAPRRLKTKRLGDTYQGYTFTDIADDHVVLEYGPRREIIPLYDSSKHTSAGGGGKTPVASTRVVYFGGGGGTAAGAPGAASSLSASAGISRPTSAPGARTTPMIGGRASDSQSARSGITRTATSQQERQAPGNVQEAPPTWNQRVDEQGRTVIRTPFGDIVRDRSPKP